MESHLISEPQRGNEECVMSQQAHASRRLPMRSSWVLACPCLLWRKCGCLPGRVRAVIGARLLAMVTRDRCRTLAAYVQAPWCFIKLSLISHVTIANNKWSRDRCVRASALVLHQAVHREFGGASRACPTGYCRRCGIAFSMHW